MCCLFGFIDYVGALSVRQKNYLIRELSIASEARGTDATGIAYNTSRGLQVYKRPLAAHRLHLRIPAEARAVMGHTRMTTQGSAIKNYNKHCLLSGAWRLRLRLDCRDPEQSVDPMRQTTWAQKDG